MENASPLHSAYEGDAALGNLYPDIMKGYTEGCYVTVPDRITDEVKDI